MDNKIVQIKIHPAIGIARVGNSDQQYYIGPESPDQPALPAGSYKDGSGKVIRQAARFRLYGYNAQGQVVKELKQGQDGVTEIKWSVHLANKKSAWYQFHIPLDIPEATALPDTQRRRRNFDVKGADRKKLVIDPGRKDIRASAQETATFDGKIMDKPVSLGSMSTQPDGRLVVVGGVGKSASYATPEKPISGVANNDTWYDDVSDGPVTAEVTFNGVTKPATPGWVVVAPPHYAPGVKTVRTLYDVLHDVFVAEQTLDVVQEVSYPDHIEPILRRFCELQWVNHGFATQFGWQGPYDFLDPVLRKRLADPGRSSDELRRQVYVHMRDYERDGTSPLPWPWLYGDAMSSGKPTSVRQHITLSAEQDRLLALWAEGHFTSGPPRTGYPDVDQAPVTEQPALLDRGALENCAADAFHPGCEVTWPVRHKTMYSEPFRILHRTQENPERDYGDVLSLQDVLSKDGPLYAQGPGDLTRWMAAPWQCDTASCRSGYQVRSGLGPRYSPYLPTFWPAQMPNHVLKKSDFTIVNTKPTGGDDSAREKAFENRAVWLRGLQGTDFDKQRRQMIDDWYKFGIVETHEYTVADGKFPRYIQVESEPGYPPAPDHANLINIQVPEAGVPQLAGAADAWTGEVDARSVSAMLVQQAVQEVKEATGHDETAIAAGYLEKLDPLHGSP
ncbi:3-isopropylmalate dehydrogenase [Streptomyces nigrescens]|uniref:3-isopropylmalate dehydrogenase n=2 Tax=Streptomyces TaxID=1883 RepID=A0ABM7ZS88_STRNI|nr:LodA/GoxA family CTQ-dependent oxidase [Streptomyces nigrescens]MEE4418433.1 LodA/GoxA family CTQ-dependent oxidase [Streptomyces sp. DSM 41528]BDM69210.1 3-isopropylmalate dehydrogenase [Streptomyces nigrescens]